MKHIDADKLIAEIERWRDKAKEKYNKNPYCMGRCDALAEFRNHIVSLLEEQPEADYNIIPLPEEKMASYIAYCLGREDDDCNCPTCGKHVTGLRLFPYYYDRDNNDVYFASVCPKCGKIIISKE